MFSLSGLPPDTLLYVLVLFLFFHPFGWGKMSTMYIEHDGPRTGSCVSVTGNGNTERTANLLVMQDIIIDLEAVKDCKEMIKMDGLKIKLTPSE